MYISTRDSRKKAFRIEILYSCVPCVMLGVGQQHLIFDADDAELFIEKLLQVTNKVSKLADERKRRLLKSGNEDCSINDSLTPSNAVEPQPTQ